jgi:outer membrane scaffolding protein for murein synthesis (MipA/OmpV family)
MKSFLAVLMVLGATAAQAELKPEWELGAGLAVVDFPLYRGASERRSYILPVPYVQYRGKFLQVDRDRVRGLLFRHDRLEMDISVNGAVPVNSSDSQSRRGMPDLAPLLEAGPSLNYHLYYDERRHTNVDLRLPVRAVFAVNTNRFDSQGWLAQPQVDLNWRTVIPGWRLSLQGSMFFGDRAYHGYYYDVDSQYATAERSAYRAAGGYGGKQLLMALSQRRGDVWMGGFVKWDDLSGAVFAGSPLVQRGQSFAAGFMVAWVFAKSERMVEVSDD